MPTDDDLVSLPVATFDRPAAVIGDIHGCLDLLDLLLERLGDRPLLVAGDVCDRGPDTRGVIERLIGRGAAGVRGNHEEWLIAWAGGQGFDDFALHPSMGGRATLASYGVTGSKAGEIEPQSWRIPSAHRDWLSSLALALDLRVMGERYWLAHAGVAAGSFPEMLPAGNALAWLASQRPRELLWRGNALERPARLDRPVIMGHVPLDEPVDRGVVIAVDSGAGTLPRGRLSAVLLPERELVTVGR